MEPGQCHTEILTKSPALFWPDFLLADLADLLPPIVPSFTYRRYKEWDPGHHHEHRGGEIHRQDEGAQEPGEQKLEPVRPVVTCSNKGNTINSFSGPHLSGNEPSKTQYQ